MNAGFNPLPSPELSVSLFDHQRVALGWMTHMESIAGGGLLADAKVRDCRRSFFSHLFIAQGLGKKGTTIANIVRSARCHVLLHSIVAGCSNASSEQDRKATLIITSRDSLEEVRQPCCFDRDCFRSGRMRLTR